MKLVKVLLIILLIVAIVFLTLFLAAWIAGFDSMGSMIQFIMQQFSGSGSV